MKTWWPRHSSGKASFGNDLATLLDTETVVVIQSSCIRQLSLVLITSTSYSDTSFPRGLHSWVCFLIACITYTNTMKTMYKTFHTQVVEERRTCVLLFFHHAASPDALLNGTNLLYAVLDSFIDHRIRYYQLRCGQHFGLFGFSYIAFITPFEIRFMPLMNFGKHCKVSSRS